MKARSWARVLGAALLVVTASGCKESKSEIAPTPDTRESPAPVKPPSGTMSMDGALRAFIGNVRDGEWDHAYSLMAPRYRATVSVDEFTRTVRAHAYFYTPTSLDSFKNGSNANTGFLNGLVHGPAGTYDIVATFVSEGGEWRISGLTVGGSEVLPRFAVPPAATSSTPAPGGKPRR